MRVVTDVPASDLAAYDAAVDALPGAALADELAAIATWADPAPGLAPKAERLAVLRAALARGADPTELREQFAVWWAFGHSGAGERMWARDIAECRTGHAPVVAQKPERAKETQMGRGTNEEVAARRDALRAVLPATSAEVKEQIDAYVGRDIGMLLGDMRAIGATRGPGKVWSLDPVEPAAPKKTRAERDRELDAPARRRVAEALAATRGEHTDPVRPSLARAAREAIREANESDAPVYLEPAFAKALHGMLVEAGL